MNILHTVQRRQGNWIGHILRRNCTVKPVMEGKLKWRTEMTARRGRRFKQLLNDLKEKRGYLKLKEEAFDSAVWRTRFGRGNEPFVRQATQWMKFHINIILPSKSLTSKLSLSFTLFSQVFSTETLLHRFLSPMRVACPAHLILFDLSARKVLGGEKRQWTFRKTGYTVNEDPY